jgi:hypothetical protein
MYEDKFNYCTRKYLFQTKKDVNKGDVPLKTVYNFINESTYKCQTKGATYCKLKKWMVLNPEMTTKNSLTYLKLHVKKQQYYPQCLSCLRHSDFDLRFTQLWPRISPLHLVTYCKPPPSTNNSENVDRAGPNGVQTSHFQRS